MRNSHWSWRGLLAAAHDRAQRVAQGVVGPQAGNNIGCLMELGEQVRDVALGLGPQPRGAPGSVSSVTRCPTGER